MCSVVCVYMMSMTVKQICSVQTKNHYKTICVDAKNMKIKQVPVTYSVQV